jgi:D-alanyl-D-alanine carboxypeptidase/D-alanyl-D-alanine-endopeptidase (penicillin-binding protein 4)
MKKFLIFVVCVFLVGGLFAQTISTKLKSAFQQFESDSQLAHAISSLYVIDSKSGGVIFDKNSQVGLAPASTQKVITSVTAFELLGKDYRYKTELSYNGNIEKGVLNGNLFIIASGDPTLGSWRWGSTKPDSVLGKFILALKKKKISRINGKLFIDAPKFSVQTTPDGWIWQDIGNYYGAGIWGINWRENQYDLILKAGNKVGEETEIVETIPELLLPVLINQVKTAEKGTGDNAYIYMPPYSVSGFTDGTIPLGEKRFTISGATPNPPEQFASEFKKEFDKNNIKIANGIKFFFEKPVNKQKWQSPTGIMFTQFSPPLDSIIYWLNKKSINLYGEALVKTLAYEKQAYARTDSGVAIVKNFWQQNGLDETELNIIDGSGLSPQNRVTTHAQVEILKYAKNRPWFLSFYNSLPEYNGMIMKSGTISDVKSFCGYHTSMDGVEYIFSFLVNNYNGSASLLVQKMYKVLDLLK